MANAYAGYGFPAEAPVNYIFPSEMFTTGSDLTPLEQHMEELLSGLTDWEPETKELGLVQPDMIEILPGIIVPKMIRKICSMSRVPVICGGLIQEKEDVLNALASGATAISTTCSDVWFM